MLTSDTGDMLFSPFRPDNPCTSPRLTKIFSWLLSCSDWSGENDVFLGSIRGNLMHCLIPGVSRCNLVSLYKIRTLLLDRSFQFPDLVVKLEVCLLSGFEVPSPWHAGYALHFIVTFISTFNCTSLPACCHSLKGLCVAQREAKRSTVLRFVTLTMIDSFRLVRGSRAVMDFKPETLPACGKQGTHLYILFLSKRIVN